MDRARDVEHSRRRVQRDRVAPIPQVDTVPQVDADEAGQPPHRIAQAIEALVVEHRHGHDVELRMCERRCFVGLRRGDDRRQLDAGGCDLGPHRLELVERRVRSVAEHDRVGVAQDAEQRPAAAAVVGAPSISPGISTSCTSTPPIRVSAGTGRVVVNA